MGEVLPFSLKNEQNPSLENRLRSLQVGNKEMDIKQGYVRVVVATPGDERISLVLGDFKKKDIVTKTTSPLFGAVTILSWDEFLESGLKAPVQTEDAEKISQLLRTEFRVLKGGKAAEE